MKIPYGFDFLRKDGKDFPLFNKKKDDIIISYSESMNSKRKFILLHGNLFNKRAIYKYFDRRYFVSYIANNHFSLCFRQISEWRDPYEKRFYNADYELFRNEPFIREDHLKLYACCFTSQNESEPSWNMYIDESQKAGRKVCVQAQFDFKALLDYLNYYIENELKGEFLLIVCPVKYLARKTIDNLHRPDKKGNLNSKYFDNFDFSKYLKLLSLKRNAFIYEQEIRFFLIPKSTKKLGKQIIIPIENECLSNVPKTKKWRKILNHIFLDPLATDKEVSCFKELLKKKNFNLGNDKIKVSPLMSDINSIVIGETVDEEEKRIMGCE